MTTSGLPQPYDHHRKLGRRDIGTPLWERRYAILGRDGFVPDEQSRLSAGVISSPRMLKGRAVRRKWYAQVKKQFPKMTAAEYDKLVMDMYDEMDWRDPWSQFYPEGYGDEWVQKFEAIGI